MALCCVAALRMTDDPRAYVGARSVEATEDAGPKPQEASIVSQMGSTTQRQPSTPIIPARVDDADRWRFAFTLHTFGFAGIGTQVGLAGAGVSAYLGIGVPSPSRVRYTRHTFGVASDLMYAFVPRSATHRHRVAASGLIGHDTSVTRRYLSLYYFAGAGAAIQGRNAGGSFGGRVGLGSSRDLHYIIALGIDLDLLHEHNSATPGMALIFSLSLLAFGML